MGQEIRMWFTEFADGMKSITFLEVGAMVAAYLFCHFLRYRNARGPTVWPIVGMVPSLSRNFKQAYDWVTKVLQETGGTFEFIVPWIPSLNCVVTSNPANIEYILKTNFANYPKGRTLRLAFEDLLGDGIFNSDHEQWLLQRKVASLEFYAKGFRELTARSIQGLVSERLVPVLDDVAQRNATVDLQDVMLRFTFDNICLLAFGEDPGCLSVGLPKIAFAKAFDVATTLTLLRLTVPEFRWRLDRMLGIRRERRLQESVQQVVTFADEVIKRRKTETRNSGKHDLLSCFLRLRDANGDPYSNKFLRDVAVNFILAGRDTSSVALAWFFWLLSQNPLVELNIVNEIAAIVRKRDGKVDEFEFGVDDLKQMYYLHAAITESLRLYPSVPVDNKEVIEDDVLPDGMKVKKGGRVLYSIYSMGRMEEIWGKDCCEFKPERWIKNGVFVPESPFKYTAFNAGPRLCLGKDVAYLQMKSIAAAILCRYSVKVVDGHVVKQKLSLTLFMRNGLPVILQPRTKL